MSLPHGIPVEIEEIRPIEPVPVHITGTSIDEPVSAPYASFQTFPLVGTEPAFQVLGMDAKRKRAVVLIQPGYSNGNTTGFVLIGTRAQVQNGQGGVLVSGNSIVLENTREWWIQPDGSHALTVVTLDERYS